MVPSQIHFHCTSTGTPIFFFLPFFFFLAVPPGALPESPAIPLSGKPSCFSIIPPRSLWLGSVSPLCFVSALRLHLCLFRASLLCVLSRSPPPLVFPRCLCPPPTSLSPPAPGWISPGFSVPNPEHLRVSPYMPTQVPTSRAGFTLFQS